MGPNITQLPKHIRQDLIGKEPGKHIVTVDVVAEEVAILMALAGNKYSFSVYSKDKRDLYVHIQSQVKALKSFSRGSVKTIIISYIYGMRRESMSKEFGISRLRCDKIISGLERIFFLENDYLDKREAQARKIGHVQQFGCYLKVTNTTPSTNLRNFFIQSTGSHLLREVCNAIQSGQVDASVLFCLHDSVTFSIDLDGDDVVEHVQTIIADVSERILGAGYRLRTAIEHVVFGEEI